jgi:DNA/RNA endonuclease YhcR with UshA esterase domain
MWADKYRDSDRNGTGERYRRTRQWHFVDIELDNPNLDQACHNHPGLPPGMPASRGPADACIVDKIDQFKAELANPETAPEEQLVALKFLLHLAGDVHQPLHAADDHDAGGNKKQVIVDGFTANNLHHFWDIEFIGRLGAEPTETAAQLIARISDEQRRAWSTVRPPIGRWSHSPLPVITLTACSPRRAPMGSMRSRQPMWTLRQMMWPSSSARPGSGSLCCSTAFEQVRKRWRIDESKGRGILNLPQILTISAWYTLLAIVQKPARGTMRQSRMLALCAVVVFGSLPAVAAPISPEEAAGHVGENATVCGAVVSAHYAARSKSQPTFLNLGKAYPEQIFTAVIFGSDRPKFGEPEKIFPGKRICVTGKVELYRGTPEIVLHDPEQLQK